MSGEAVDGDTLNNLRALQKTEGAPSILHKVITTYLVTAPKLLVILRDSLATGDTATIQFTAHSLGSSSATLGALRLLALCRELEAMCRDNSPDFTEELLSKIEAEYDAVRDALKDELQRYP